MDAQPLADEDSTSSLPAELTDEIIGWIGASTKPWKDLSACGLVCKAWLPASRSHLFHSIQITMGKATRWNAFLKSSHLTSYLRHVEILEKPALTEMLSHEEALAQAHTVYELLPQLAQLTTVASLCVDVISWLPLEDTHVAQLCVAFRNVTDLELRNGKIRDNLQLMHIISHFALLERVALVKVKIKDFEPIPEDLAGKLSPYLHTVKIWYRKAVLGPEDWLCKPYPLTSVRHLELRDIPPSELVSAGYLMQHLGSKLSTLSLSFNLSVDSSTIPTHFLPRYNTSLRVVHLTMDLSVAFAVFSLARAFDHPIVDAPSWTWLCLFLSAIPSPLTSLRIDILADGGHGALLHLDWASLAQALDGPQFSVLNALRLEIPLRDAEVAVRERLPNMYGRGILEIVTAAPEFTLDDAEQL